MPLDKRPTDRVGTVAVTFRVPAEVGAHSAVLLGEFSDWSPVPMSPSDDGGYEVTVEIPAGGAYRFRYLLDDARWANDWAADDYVQNEYGSDDSVLIVEQPSEHGEQDEQDQLGKQDAKHMIARRNGDATSQ